MASLSDDDGFLSLDESMTCVGLSNMDKFKLFRVAASVLHLGNIEFQENTADRKGKSSLPGLCQERASDFSQSSQNSCLMSMCCCHVGLSAATQTINNW